MTALQDIINPESVNELAALFGEHWLNKEMAYCDLCGVWDVAGNRHFCEIAEAWWCVNILGLRLTLFAGFLPNSLGSRVAIRAHRIIRMVRSDGNYETRPSAAFVTSAGRSRSPRDGTNV